MAEPSSREVIANWLDDHAKVWRVAEVNDLAGRMEHIWSTQMDAVRQEGYRQGLEQAAAIMRPDIDEKTVEDAVAIKLLSRAIDKAATAQVERDEARRRIGEIQGQMIDDLHELGEVLGHPPTARPESPQMVLRRWTAEVRAMVAEVRRLRPLLGAHGIWLREHCPHIAALLAREEG